MYIVNMQQVINTFDSGWDQTTFNKQALIYHVIYYNKVQPKNIKHFVATRFLYIGLRQKSRQMQHGNINEQSI